MGRYAATALGLLLLATCAAPARGWPPVHQGPPMELTWEARDLAVSELRFAIDLHRELAGRPGNVFVSPHSIAEVVSMAAVAARGGTEEALRATLRLDMESARLPKAYRNLDDALTRLTRATRSSRLVPTVNIGNALWADRRYGFKPAYVTLLRDGFSADARNADFAEAAEGAARQINAWVARLTEGRIQRMVDAGSLRPDAGLVLLNAVFFRAPWELQFEVGDTEPREFTDQAGRRFLVPMMRKTCELRYLDEDGWQLVELPYTGVEASLVLLLPRPGRLAEVEGALDAEVLPKRIADARPRLVAIDLPRIKMRAAASLEAPLRRLGMGPAFETTADFGGATDVRPCFVDAVLHQAVLEVDEEGTVAAAASGVCLPVGPVDIPAPIPFVVDRPFLLLLRNTRTGAPLFFGRITDPGTRAP